MVTLACPVAGSATPFMPIWVSYGSIHGRRWTTPDLARSAVVAYDLAQRQQNMLWTKGHSLLQAEAETHLPPAGRSHAAIAESSGATPGFRNLSNETDNITATMNSLRKRLHVSGLLLKSMLEVQIDREELLTSLLPYPIRWQ